MNTMKSSWKRLSKCKNSEIVSGWLASSTPPRSQTRRTMSLIWCMGNLWWYWDRIEKSREAVRWKASMEGGSSSIRTIPFIKGYTHYIMKSRQEVEAHLYPERLCLPDRKAGLLMEMAHQQAFLVFLGCNKTKKKHRMKIQSLWSN